MFLLKIYLYFCFRFKGGIPFWFDIFDENYFSSDSSQIERHFATQCTFKLAKCSFLVRHGYFSKMGITLDKYTLQRPQYEGTSLIFGVTNSPKLDRDVSVPTQWVFGYKMTSTKPVENDMHPELTVFDGSLFMERYRNGVLHSQWCMKIGTIQPSRVRTIECIVDSRAPVWTFKLFLNAQFSMEHPLPSIRVDTPVHFVFGSCSCLKKVGLLKPAAH